jgi:enoyl-CoA hydratase/carnithine racemase
MTSAAPSALVQVNDVDGVRWIRMNRPERRNALTSEMYAVLAGALDSANDNTAVRVVVLQGAGGAFTSGNDLGDFLNNPQAGLVGPVADFLAALVRLDKPFVVGVQGPAVGVGASLLLHADVVIAASNASFLFPFTNLGVVPEAGSSLLLPQLCGLQEASALLLLGEPFDAAHAQRINLVHRVVAIDALDAEVAAVAKRLADKPLGALVATRRLLRAPQRERLLQVMATEGDEFVARLSSPEAVEAFTAFFEKRKPDFRKLG